MRFHKDPWSISGFRVEMAAGQPVSHFGEFLLDQNHVLDFHSHTTWELVLQTKGASTWTEGSRKCTLQEGDLLICPPELPHGKTHRGESAFRIYFCGMSMDFALWPALLPYLSQNHMVKISHAIELARNFRILEDELLSERPRQQDGVHLAWRQLWLAVFRLASTPQRTWERADMWVSQRVKGLVESQPGEPWALPTMARMLGYSANHFAGIFKKQSGQSFHQYLMDVRIEAAKEALRHGERSLTEIALQTGFCSSQHFSNAFSKKTGSSPSKWLLREKPATNK